MQIIDLKVLGHSSAAQQAARVIKAGGLVIFPTETTYGAGVDATNQAAVDKLLAYKTRREGKPLSIAVTDIHMAEQYVELSDSARRLYERFLPGPITVISHSTGKVALGVASEFGTLGVRIPDYELVLEIVDLLGKPMTATSANASGEKRPYSISDLMANLTTKQQSLIDLVIDAGTLPPNPPSTIIDTTLSTPTTLREGTLEAGSSLADSLDLLSVSEAETKAIAQRLLLKHWELLKSDGLVIGLDGELGVGKTIFTKGAADFLQIQETVASPTYTYIEEYDFDRHGFTGQLYHLDMWKIETEEEWQRLEVASLIRAGTVVIIEWYSQVKPWLRTAISQLENAPALITIQISQQIDQRTLRIQEQE
ncbi:MAG: L-threonylcarbamoyladenylate synthase [bacterium]|nr:L-threonylcarbamoyladenylate synthase [bacterium]